MRHISETKAIEALDAIRKGFVREIRDGFEHRALSCLACPAPGACCLDEHFVNVRISRLEAVTIRRRIDELPEADELMARVEAAVEKYRLGEAGEFFACPLYEKGVGCLVHETAKPLPCIAHACYERKEDLPPDELLAEREAEVDELNARVYGRTGPRLPIPLAITRSGRP